MTQAEKVRLILVDTHILRLPKKLGLTNQTDPVKIEEDLMKIVPKDKWTDFFNLLISHDICVARDRTCKGCPFLDLCPDRKE